MEVLVGLSLVLAGIVGGAGLIVVYRRRLAERNRLRSEELRALDERIAARIAGLRDGTESAAAAPQPRSDDELADLARPIPALLPLETGRSWRSRLGLRGPSDRDVDGAERGTALRDTAVVLGVGLVLLLVASQFLPASTPPPTGTATPTASNLTANVPTGTPNLLRPTASPTLAAGETPKPTVDITYEPTSAPTATPYTYVPPPAPHSTPRPTAAPTVTPCPILGITITPQSATITYGGSQSYQAVAYNSCGQNIEVTSGTSFTVGGAACAGAVCTPTSAGAKTVTGTYVGKSNSGSLTVDKAPATLSFGGLSQTYDGGSHPVTVTTSPAGLTVVTVTYSSGSAPIDAGSYTVDASLSNANYTAPPITDTLVVAQAPTTTTIGTVINNGDGTFTVPWTVSSSPSGTVTVSDGTNSCSDTVAAGSCVLTSSPSTPITATYGGEDPNYLGSSDSGSTPA